MGQEKDWQGSKVPKGQRNNQKNSEAPQTTDQHPNGDTGLVNTVHKPNVVAVLFPFASPLRGCPLLLVLNVLLVPKSPLSSVGSRPLSSLPSFQH